MNVSSSIIIQYCGTTIAGLSLLSDCVMRLVRTDESKYVQGSETADDYRKVEQPQNKETTKSEGGTQETGQYYADIWLKRRSLYIMKYRYLKRTFI